MPERDLPDLLEILGIDRVVVVDDQFLPQLSQVEDVFEKPPEIDGLAVPAETPFDTFLSNNWDELSPEVKIALRDTAIELGAKTYTGDPLQLEWLADSAEYIGLTQTEWEEQREEKLEGAQRALILFDVNFKSETGDADDDSGLALARSEFQQKSRHVVGLLTGEERREEWVRKVDITESELVIVDKRLASSEGKKDRQQAIEQIRTALQAAQLSSLRRRVRERFYEELDAVEKRLTGNAPSVLEDVVFRTSSEGGAWEADTWFRFFEALGSTNAKLKLAKNKDVRTDIAAVRQLLALKPERVDSKESVDLIRDLDEKEAYYGKDAINEAGMPIANGDIFKTDTGKLFVLVGQPCDLEIRSDGRRARDVDAATLLPLKPTRRKIPHRAEDQQEGEQEPRQAQAPPVQEETRSAFKMPPGCPGGSDEKEALMKPEFTVSLDILDLVSYNESGKAELNPEADDGLNPHLPGLQKRLDKIKDEAAKTIKKVEFAEKLREAGELDKTSRNQIQKGLFRGWPPFQPANGAMGSGSYSFNFKRIGRLRGTYADALLVAHAAARSRTAHAYRLSRILASEA